MDIESDESAVFFERDGAYIPSGLARGPWDPDAMHGGPVAALIAREVERSGFADGMEASRITIELLRPVRLRPLRLEARLVRPGKRVNLVEVSVRADGDETVVARAVALGMRSADVDVGGNVEPPYEMPLAPDVGHPPVAPGAMNSTYSTFYGSAVEMQVVRGEFWEPGPATAWFRLIKPIVAGEEPSQLMRVCAAADFGNGISSVLPINQFLFINPDLTVYLHRPAIGEWICLEASTWPGNTGMGIAESALYDSAGRVGRSVQSLFIDRR